MSKEDYYSVLNVKRNASNEEIKKTYRRLAMKYHPDRNPDNAQAEGKFKEVNEAYNILSNKLKRQAYDMHGHAGVDESAAVRHAAQSSNFSDIVDDIFGDIFGGVSSRSGGTSSRLRVQQGGDIRYSLVLSLEEAAQGMEVKIRVACSHVHCSTCRGTGAKKGVRPIKCRTCEGNGQMRMQQGFFTIQQTCPTCFGHGEVVFDKCRYCKGTGLVEKEKKLLVKVPAGIDDGDNIRLAGEGEPGQNGGPSGDLYVHVNVRVHKIFQRNGVHLYCEVPISCATAALGGEIEIPTLKSRLKLKVPTKTQEGKLFRLKGKGICSVRGEGPGDLLCRIRLKRR